MAVKTIILTGAETAVTGLDGFNAAIRNDGEDIIYASKQSHITPGADGVLSIPAGGSAVLLSIIGTVYLSGKGSAMIITSDYGDNLFKPSARGGSGADKQARAAINSHTGDTKIHVTADEKSAWNAKAELSDIPTALPANGGNADTLELHSASDFVLKSEYNQLAAQVFSNPNLLINPDFRINQRGASGVISDAGYFIDRWQLVSGTAEITANGILLNGAMKQILEYAAGTNVTASASAGTASYDDSTRTFTLTAAGETIEWVKLEPGGYATPFYPPDPATELTKCQRYFCRGECGVDMKSAFYSPNACQAIINFPTSMRVKPTVSIFSWNGTPNTLSEWDSGFDVADLNDIIASLTETTGVYIIYSPGNKFTVDDRKMSFRYTADAEL